MPNEADDTLFSTSYAKIVDLISEGVIVGLLGTPEPGLSNGPGDPEDHNIPLDDGAYHTRTFYRDPTDAHLYLDETPLRNADGTENYEGTQVQGRSGYLDQGHISGFSGSNEQVNVSIEVTKDAPGAVIKSFHSSVVDAVSINMFTPAMIHTNSSNGDVNGTTIDFKIYMRKDFAGAWDLLKSPSFKGKTTSKYEKSYRIDIPPDWKTEGFSAISIKVERVTDDSTSARLQNKLIWSSYTKVIDNKLTYPNSALMATNFSAENFSSVPKRAYEIKGVMVDVPDNYTPYDPGHCTASDADVTTAVEATKEALDALEAGADLDEVETIQPNTGSGYRSRSICETEGHKWTGTQVGDNLYNGTWSGEFKKAWTCNPAWILYDICSNSRYGLGKWLDENSLDKWSLYEIAKYCDGVNAGGDFVGVSDGLGGKEARFACNLYLQGHHEAFSVLNEIASVFRGMLYWQSGQVVGVQDAPKEPVMLFSSANVQDGQFLYEGTSKKQRHNVAYVTWNNPEDFYKSNVEYVEDRQGIIDAAGQLFTTDVKAVGCTSQAQARRLGRWMLYTERLETEVVTFSTGLEGAMVRPGDIIKIADNTRSGVRYGGRIAAGSSSSIIKLDAPTPVTAGNTYRLSLINTEEACIRSGAKQSETTQETCLNANADNEWKPYVRVETKDAAIPNTTPEYVEEITVDEPFSNHPTSEYMWILEEVGSAESQDFRVLSLKETEPNIIAVNALRYHEGKFGLIDEDDSITIKNISKLPIVGSAVPKPRNLSVSEELYRDSRNAVKNRVTCSWEPPVTAGTSVTYPYTSSYYVEWKREKEDNWVSAGKTSGLSIIIDDVPAGNLDFRVKTRRVF